MASKGSPKSTARWYSLWRDWRSDWRTLGYLWSLRQNLKQVNKSLLGVDLDAPMSEENIWRLYRLNMYASVAKARAKGSLGWKGWLAKAVSHAACGQFEEARAAVKEFLQSRGAPAARSALIDSLLRFMPADALALMEGQPNVSPTLVLAALLRHGGEAELARARAMLADLPAGAEQRWPELRLWRTNVVGGMPDEQLQRVNGFLATYGVTPLRLLDAAQPPSAFNVAVQEAPAPVEGGPLVTVLMTTFRSGKRVEAAIASVLAQSWRNLELIVVDDASGDETPVLLQALAARDARLRFVPLQRNVGTYAAKSIGLNLARGEFVTCHDSDDWSHPLKIERQMAPLLAQPKLICTVSSWVRIADDGRFGDHLVHPLLRLNHSSPLFRREQVLRDTGAWDTGVRTGADAEFLARLRLLYGTPRILKINQPLSFGGRHPDSLTSAADTGFVTGADALETGMADDRLAYAEAWRRWHVECMTPGRELRLPASTPKRPFEVPPKIQVQSADFALNLKEADVWTPHDG